MSQIYRLITKKANRLLTSRLSALCQGRAPERCENMSSTVRIKKFDKELKLLDTLYLVIFSEPRHQQNTKQHEFHRSLGLSRCQSIQNLAA
jgi:hypothetical protein